MYNAVVYYYSYKYFWAGVCNLISTFEKRILDKIAGLLENPVGVCREDGTILYPEKTRKKVPLRSPEKAEAFFREDGYCFLKTATSDGETAYLFLRGDEENCRSVLNLASVALEKETEKETLTKEDLLKDILQGKSVGKSEIKEAMKSSRTDQKVSGSAVIYIKAISQGAVFSGDDIEVLKSIFPVDAGFETVPMEKDAVAVISFLTKENDYANVMELAGAVRETMQAETMTNVCVAVGNEVSSFDKISSSYEDAVRICETGISFGLVEGALDEKKLGVASLVCELPVGVCERYLESILGSIDTEEKTGRELIDTVNCFLENNQNVSETSRVLYVHRNTLMYRVEKFNKLTGLDCTKFEDGVRIRLAIQILRYLKTKKQASV